MNFSKILKELRTENGLSAKELSSKINLSTNIIYDWEHGRCEPSYTVLIKLSKIFDCSVGYLIGAEDDFGNVVINQDLTEEEKKLIYLFNQLSNTRKKTILDTMQDMVELNNLKYKNNV